MPAPSRAWWPVERPTGARWHVIRQVRGDRRWKASAVPRRVRMGRREARPPVPICRPQLAIARPQRPFDTSAAPPPAAWLDIMPAEEVDAGPAAAPLACRYNRGQLRSAGWRSPRARSRSPRRPPGGAAGQCSLTVITTPSMPERSGTGTRRRVAEPGMTVRRLTRWQAPGAAGGIPRRQALTAGAGSGAAAMFRRIIARLHGNRRRLASEFRSLWPVHAIGNFRPHHALRPSVEA